MIAPRRARRTWWLGCAVLVAAVVPGLACSGGGTAAPEPGQLTINPGWPALVVGDTLHLTVAVAGSSPGDGNIGWSSSDRAVATVDDGVVTAAGPGTATITATHAGATGRAFLSVVAGGGQRVAALAAFDSIIPGAMRAWGIPGGAVAVVKDGRLLLARGYGWADVEAGEMAGPEHLFRVASVSKPITAAAILALYEEGMLDLDAPVFAMLDDLPPPDGATEDPRLADITIRQLLYHSGGWDRNATFDPMFRPIIAAESVGAPAPASAETVIRYMRGQPLQFDPGEAYAYSNLGYAILGRIIERVTGESYEDHVRSEVLGPAGISRMRIGSTLVTGRAEGEVSYYDAAVVPSVFSPADSVPITDGGFHLEAMDAHGGWIGSVVDLLRFVTAVDGRPGRPDVLRQTTLQTMVARPGPPLWTGSSYYYAMGWLVRPTGGDANWWHDGSLPGTTALLVRAHNGLAWAALFNARAGRQSGSFAADLDQAIWRAVESVDSWPQHDFFTALY